MAKKPVKPSVTKQPPYHRGADIPMRIIRGYVRQIAEKFQPEKIILFGSHAYGTPHEDSDVDILVVMSAWNELSKALKIRTSIEAPFPTDVIVRTPKHLAWRLAEHESFHTEITKKGIVLYEKVDPRLDHESRGRFRRHEIPCFKSSEALHMQST